MGWIKWNISDKGFGFEEKREIDPWRLFHLVESPKIEILTLLLSLNVFFKGHALIWIELLWVRLERNLVFGEVSDDAVQGFVMFDHLLMVTPTLFMGTTANCLAHHAVEVPLPSVFLASLNHRFEFEQETHIFLIFLVSPMRSRVLFARTSLTLIQTVNHLFRSEDPGLYRVPGDHTFRNYLRLSLGEFRSADYGIHACLIILKILLNSSKYY